MALSVARVRSERKMRLPDKGYSLWHLFFYAFVTALIRKKP